MRVKKDVKRPTKPVRITFRIDEDCLMILGYIAKREGMSVSLIVRSVLYRYLENYKKLNPVG